MASRLGKGEHNHGEGVGRGGRGNQGTNETSQLVNQRIVTGKRQALPPDGRPPLAQPRPALDSCDGVGLPLEGPSSGLFSGSGPVGLLQCCDSDAPMGEFDAAEDGDAHAGCRRWIPAVRGGRGEGKMLA